MKRLRVGVFGAGRGMDIASNFMLLDCDIVAICDFHTERLESASKRLGESAAVYKDFDSFIEHPMDVSCLASMKKKAFPLKRLF